MKQVLKDYRYDVQDAIRVGVYDVVRIDVWNTVYDVVRIGVWNTIWNDVRISIRNFKRELKKEKYMK